MYSVHNIIILLCKEPINIKRNRMKNTQQLFQDYGKINEKELSIYLEKGKHCRVKAPHRFFEVNFYTGISCLCEVNYSFNRIYFIFLGYTKTPNNFIIYIQNVYRLSCCAWNNVEIKKTESYEIIKRTRPFNRAYEFLESWNWEIKLNRTPWEG